jgi:hypothetical protein
MAGLIAEGGFAALSGTNNSANPVTIADFRPGTSSMSKGTDGLPCGGYRLKNNDTTGTLVMNIQINGLHNNNTASAYAVMPGDTGEWKLGTISNGIRFVKGWTSTLTGATTSSTITVSGGVFIRLD